jgi:hypothetical protein
LLSAIALVQSREEQAQLVVSIRKTGRQFSRAD